MKERDSVQKVRYVAVFGAFLVGFVSSLALSGCGGGSDAPVSSVTPTMTPEQQSESAARAAAEAAEKKK